MAEPGWGELPEPVRVRLAEVASTAVGAFPAAELPVSVRPMARFTPRKRARLGAGALLGELRRSAAFRSAVLAWWTEHRPDELTGPEVDPVSAAAGALLAGDPVAGELVAGIAGRVDAASLRSERDAALARVDKLSAELERLRTELAEAATAGLDLDAARDRELDRLRGRLREQGTRLRLAEDATKAAQDELELLRRTAEERLTAALTQRDRERQRATVERTRAARASEEASGARQAAREARRADEVRLELLMDTLAGAVAGLRRELALGDGGSSSGGPGGGGPRPGDLVRGASGRLRGAPLVSDLPGLDRLLGLPAVHLVVDGYNVSKTGYPELTLFDQRARLVAALGALAARTGAEVTVVFDGAAVVGGPDRSPRGVRVLFSDAGVIADNVIRELVAAEPPGRPVVVVSSDRAVADGVRRRGAHPVPSSVLLERLARG